MQVCVVGAGYVGLVTGTCLAYLGHDVTCVDRDTARIESLRNGLSPIYEPGLVELMAACTRRGTSSLVGGLRFTTDLVAGVRAADVIFIAVGTPPLPTGEPDLQHVQAVAHAIGAALDADKPRVIVNKSTVPIGSGNWVEMLVHEGVLSLQPAGLRQTGALRDAPERPRFSVASNPEFLREGSAIGDTLYPDRIVIGSSDAETLSTLRTLYAPILEQTFRPPAVASRPEGFAAVPLVTTDLPSAEMIKYAANAFLATKISFANEIANLCEKVGADVVEVTRGMGLDARIGQRFLNAGAGWGGSCFGKDVSALIAIAREYGMEPELLKATVEVNRHQRQRIVQKLQDQLKILKGKTIGILGLAFKPNTDDLRDAPALDIIRTLLKMGARVKAYDPIAMEACRFQHPDLEVAYAIDATDCAWEADALVVVTEWEEFRSLDLDAVRAVMRSAHLVDARNVFTAEAAHVAGFDYTGIGR